MPSCAATGALEGAAPWLSFSQRPAEFDLLQILAHGVRNESRVDPQGIALPDGSMWSEHLDGARLPSCVFLSADLPGERAIEVRGIATMFDPEKGVLYLNPGSIGPRRFNLPVATGRLVVENARVTGEILHLPI